MKQFIARLLGIKPEVQVQYRVVETSEPRMDLSEKEYREVVQTLASHPGFLALIKKLSTQRAYLRSQLESNPKADLHFLQAGIYWCRWLSNEIRLAAMKVPERKVDPMEEELRAWKEIDSQIERIG